MIIEVLKLLRLNFQILDQKKLDPIKKKRRFMYVGTCTYQLFPLQCRSSATTFTTGYLVKLRQIFTAFAVSLSGQKLNSKKAIRFFVRPNFPRLLKRRKTDEDLQYAVKTSRSISTSQS